MKTFQPLGPEKHLGTALRIFEGVGNRRTWEALCFPVHPRLYEGRERINLDRSLALFFDLSG
jgi:hypothetical protein